MTSQKIIQELHANSERVAELNIAERKRLFRHAAKALDFWGTKAGIPTPEEAGKPGDMAFDLRMLSGEMDHLTDTVVLMLLQQAAEEIDRRQGLLNSVQTVPEEA